MAPERESCGGGIENPVLFTNVSLKVSLNGTYGGRQQGTGRRIAVASDIQGQVEVVMKTKALLILGLTMGMSAPVAAFNGVITINGEVTAGTCAIAVNGGTASATVTLPTVSTNALGSIGQTAGATGFNLALTSCPTTGSVRAYFENIGVEQTTGNLSNKAVASGGKNPAQNVEVQILSANSTPIDLRTNTGNNVLVNFSATGGATLYYSAQYIATGAVGAGLVSADLIYSLDYH